MKRFAADYGSITRVRTRLLLAIVFAGGGGFGCSNGAKTMSADVDSGIDAGSVQDADADAGVDAGKDANVSALDGDVDGACVHPWMGQSGECCVSQEDCDPTMYLCCYSGLQTCEFCGKR